MPYPLTPAQIIQIGRISMYLSINDVKKKNFQSALPYFEQQLPLLIALETDCVGWQYQINPTDTSLFQSAYYAYALYGIYAIQAQNVINVGGVIVTPVTETADFFIDKVEYPQFRVGDVDSPMNDGDTTLLIVDPLAVAETGKKTVSVHRSGYQEPQNLTGEVNFNAQFTIGQYLITFSDPVRTGDVFIIEYPVRVNLLLQTATPPVEDDEYSAVLVDFETRTLLNTAGNIFTITAGTQGKINIKLWGESTLDEKLFGEWNYYVNNVGGTITLVQSDGGILYSTFAVSMEDNIVISGNDSLQGVQIVGTGQVGSTITLKASFTYAAKPI